MKSSFVIMVTALFLGLGLGYLLGQKSQPPANTSEVAKAAGIEKLQGLTEADFAEYYRLKTLEERYLKADEILAKIVKIFLADLGMRVNPDVIRGAEESQNEKLVVERPEQVGENPQVAEPVGNSTGGFKSAVRPSTQPSTQALKSRPSTRELRHEHEIEDFLRDSQIAEFDQVIKKSSGFANKSGVLDQLNGRFFGTAKVMSRGKPTVWNIEYDLKGQIINGKFEGERTLKLSEGGKVFSNSSGSGNLGNEFREIPVDPAAIITSAGPNTFLQFYYLKSVDSLAGNILKQEDISEGFKTIGSFQLSRQ